MNAKQYRAAMRECIDAATASHPKNAELRSMLFLAIFSAHVGHHDRALGDAIFDLTTDDEEGKMKAVRARAVSFKSPAVKDRD